MSTDFKADVNYNKGSLWKQTLSSTGNTDIILSEEFQEKLNSEINEKLLKKNVSSLHSTVASSDKFPIPANKNLRNRVLKGISFEGQDLSGVDFSGADLSGAIFDNANLSKAIFFNAILDGASLNQVNLTNADLSYASLKDADLIEAILDYSNLKGTDFSNSNLSDAKFDNAFLENTNFEKANLLGASFKNATILASNFSQTILKQHLKNQLISKISTTDSGSINSLKNSAVKLNYKVQMIIDFAKKKIGNLKTIDKQLLGILPESLRDKGLLPHDKISAVKQELEQSLNALENFQYEKFSKQGPDTIFELARNLNVLSMKAEDIVLRNLSHNIVSYLAKQDYWDSQPKHLRAVNQFNLERLYKSKIGVEEFITELNSFHEIFKTETKLNTILDEIKKSFPGKYTKDRAAAIYAFTKHVIELEKNQDLQAIRPRAIKTHLSQLAKIHNEGFQLQVKSLDNEIKAAAGPIIKDALNNPDILKFNGTDIDFREVNATKQKRYLYAVTGDLTQKFQELKNKTQKIIKDFSEKIENKELKTEQVLEIYLKQSQELSKLNEVYLNSIKERIEFLKDDTKRQSSINAYRGKIFNGINKLRRYKEKFLVPEKTENITDRILIQKIKTHNEDLNSLLKSICYYPFDLQTFNDFGSRFIIAGNSNKIKNLIEKQSELEEEEALYFLDLIKLDESISKLSEETNNPGIKDRLNKAISKINKFNNELFKAASCTESKLDFKATLTKLADTILQTNSIYYKYRLLREQSSIDSNKINGFIENNLIIPLEQKVLDLIDKDFHIDISNSKE